MTAHPERLAYRVNEACQCLSIGRTTLYALANSGEIKLIKIAGRTLVPRSEIDRLLGGNDTSNMPRRPHD